MWMHGWSIEHVWMHVCVFMCACIHVWLFVLVLPHYVHIYTCKDHAYIDMQGSCIYIHARTWLNAHMYVHTHMHAQLHTRTHTHTDLCISRDRFIGRARKRNGILNIVLYNSIRFFFVCREYVSIHRSLVCSWFMTRIIVEVTEIYICLLLLFPSRERESIYIYLGYTRGKRINSSLSSLFIYI